MIIFILQLIFALIVCIFCLYTYLEWHHAKASKKRNTAQKILPAASLDDPNLPTVSVLLPVYNEEALLEKLISAVCSLTYPLDKLDIWVLDDSPHKSMELAQDLVKFYKEKGFPINYSKRTSKRGGKAGNLAHGFERSQGELICIFDADNTPQKDFLLQTVPYFSRKRLGFLQTSIDFSNKNKSFLTRFQAIMSGHKEDVAHGQAEKEYLALLTGSSCIWRRSCIEDFGGIKCLAHGEDIDMCMRAQLHGWKFAFASHVTTQAELPESMAVFRVQRERWARSAARNPLHHAKKLLHSSMPIHKRIQAMTLLFSGPILASFYVILLLTFPVVFSTKNLGIIFHLLCISLLISAIVWGYGCMKNNTPVSGTPVKKKYFWFYTLGYVLMFFPYSLYCFYGFCYIFIRGEGKFNPTPKGTAKTSAPKVNTRLLWLEVASFIYALLGFTLGIVHKNYWICLYCALAAGGFGLGLYYSFTTRKNS